MKWTFDHVPIRKITASELKFGMRVPLSKVNQSCDFCKEPAIDTCTNCEKGTCEKHSIPYVFMMVRGKPAIVLGICQECVEDNAFIAV